MKKLFCLLIIVLLFTSVGMAANVDYDFSVNQIYYKINNKAKKTVKVVRIENDQDYIEIPSQVSYAGLTFNVTTVGENSIYKELFHDDAYKYVVINEGIDTLEGQTGEIVKLTLPSTLKEITGTVKTTATIFKSISCPNGLKQGWQLGYGPVYPYARIYGDLYVPEEALNEYADFSDVAPDSISIDDKGNGAPFDKSEWSHITELGCTPYTWDTYKLLTYNDSNDVNGFLTDIISGDITYKVYSINKQLAINKINNIFLDSLYLSQNIDYNSLTYKVDSVSTDFKDCKNIKKIYSNFREPLKIDDDIFTTLVYMTATLYVPSGTLEVYKSATGWKNFENIEETNMSTSISPNKFNKESCPSIYSINGIKKDKLTKGVNIVIKNGVPRKIIVK